MVYLLPARNNSLDYPAVLSIKVIAYSWELPKSLSYSDFSKSCNKASF
jgi:hypothetical protein